MIYRETLSGESFYINSKYILTIAIKQEVGYGKPYVIVLQTINGKSFILRYGTANERDKKVEQIIEEVEKNKYE